MTWPSLRRKDTTLFASVIPSKLVEAMGMGLPILLSLPEGEATALVCRAGAGIQVPPERPRELADTIRNLAADPERLRVLANVSRAVAPAFFSREGQTCRMIDAFATVKCAPS